MQFPFEVEWHENRSSYIAVRGKKVRIHRLFQEAPTPVLEAIIAFVQKRDAKARVTIRQMIHLYFSQKFLDPIPLKSKGSFYDLQEIFDRLNETLRLEGVVIGWSERSVKSRLRSITFGSYDSARRQIRINKLLDQPGVPLYFIEFVVYHEMLHAVYPVSIGVKGRCSIHSREFREKERQFPYYTLAKEWEKSSLQFFKRSLHGRAQ